MSNIDKQAQRMRNYLNTAVISGVKLLHLTTDELSGLLDELEAAEKRIAELEAREVALPQRYSMLHRVAFDEPYHTEMVYKQHQVLKALYDAGVNVAAAGKGE